ncbi:MAG: Csu type fimbrial protein [Lysobacter sp.]
MNVFKTSLLATALIAGGVIAPAHAANNMDFDVTITIDESCDVTATQNVAFAASPATPGTVATQGSVSVQCTNGSAYDVALNAGLHSGNDINARQMEIAAGTDTIAYQLYQDNAGSAGAVWGETVGTDTDTGTGTGFGTGAPYDQLHTVHAVATLVGTEPAGNYSDTITATVTF